MVDQPANENDFDNDGDIDDDDLEIVFDWAAWNDEAAETLNYWANKYDRGECVEECETPGTPATTGTSGVPEDYICPRINDFYMYNCSNVTLYIKGG